MTHSREMLRDCQALVNTHLSFVVNNFVRRMVEVKLTLSWGLPRSTIKRGSRGHCGDSQRSDYCSNGICAI